MKSIRLFTMFLASLALCGYVLTHPVRADECDDEGPQVF